MLKGSLIQIQHTVQGAHLVLVEHSFRQQVACNNHTSCVAPSCIRGAALHSDRCTGCNGPMMHCSSHLNGSQREGQSSHDQGKAGPS